MVLPRKDAGGLDTIERSISGHVGLAGKAGTAKKATAVGPFVAFPTFRLMMRQYSHRERVRDDGLTYLHMSDML